MSRDTQNIYFVVGAFDGGIMRPDGVVSTTQIFNLDHAEVWNQAGGSSVGLSAIHEMVESFLGAQQNRASLTIGNSYGYSALSAAHAATLNVVPNGNIPNFAKVPISTGGMMYGLKDSNGAFYLLYTVP